MAAQIEVHLRDQILMITLEPVTEARSLGFVKDIVHDETGKWHVTVTPAAEEAAVYGDECEVLISWLNTDRAIVIDGADEKVVCQFSRIRKSILSQ